MSFYFGKGENMNEKFIKQLPEPSTVEEKLIYNFVAGKEIYPVSPLKTKDIYLQVLLACLSERQTAPETTITAATLAATAKKKAKAGA